MDGGIGKQNCSRVWCMRCYVPKPKRFHKDASLKVFSVVHIILDGVIIDSNAER